MKIKKVLLALVISGCCLSTGWAQNTQVIAHRGYWNTMGSAQNSLAALVKADSVACYGSEFDVWLSADDQLIVNHDNSYQGHPMEETISQKLLQLPLGNGESLPTLDAYLSKAQSLTTRLIFELKPHKDPIRETLAIELSLKMLHQKGLEDRTEFITFSKHALKEFIRLAPKGAPVYYLNGELSPSELKELGAAGADYHLNVFKKHPEWIEDLHRLGLKVNVWTVNKEQDMQWAIDHKVDYITTNEPVLLQEVLKKQK